MEQEHPTNRVQQMEQIQAKALELFRRKNIDYK